MLNAENLLRQIAQRREHALEQSTTAAAIC